ncbi:MULTISPECIES: ABC-three component system middle component 1 [Paenibacillus]|uniref:ABC-three component system middle component 1 n=1 Tax=Paenibacillus TaxID=44249 RepID=UPI000FDA419F|nr:MULTISPECIES: ABC-three component system middle component 1 [Paenibacillus]
MIEELVEFFEGNGFIELDQLDFNYLDTVYASSEQIYGLVQFETEEELRENWEKAADELAVKLQSRLIKELHMLKWDIYLMVICTQNQIDTSYRKLIENDRRYFRKIVITKKDDPYISKVPFVLDLTSNKELLIFNDNEFFEELRECLQKSTLSKLPQEFFNSKLSGDQLIDFFNSIKKDDIN